MTLRMITLKNSLRTLVGFVHNEQEFRFCLAFPAVVSTNFAARDRSPQTPELYIKSLICDFNRKNWPLIVVDYSDCFHTLWDDSTELEWLFDSSLDVVSEHERIFEKYFFEKGALARHYKEFKEGVSKELE